MSTPPPPPRPSIRPPGLPTSRKPEAVQPVSEARAEAVFNGAVALPESAREEFLAVECRGDEALLGRVQVLLAAHSDGSEFLDEPKITPEIEAELARLKPEEEGERIANYKLLQQIGEGGFGSVWMAEQLEPVRRRVALKIIKLGMDTREVIGRFEQERQALAMMDHPNIARVFDAGATQFGRPYFVMELVKGIPITQFCDEAGLGTRERLALFGDVCSAIQHAHQKGIIHRDIKPSNVMVTLHGDKPVVKVIDFGIAKATQDRLTDKTLFTRFEQFIGTPVYMSPEQAALSGLDIDTRSDIYALGILLYELLTGKPPFDAQTLASAGYDEMRRIIREVEPPRPSLRLGTVVGEERTTIARARHIEPEKLSRLVEPDLDWIVMKAIEKDRTRRYETANGLAADIKRFLADEPVSASPPSAGYQLRKFARRNKAALRVAAAIAAVLVAATVVSTWQAVRATSAEQKIAETLAQVAAERDAKEIARHAASEAENLAKGRLAEVAAERDAKDQARKDAEAISTFLTEVFQSPDPARDGRTITVAETLDKAAKRLETDLADQPDRRAKLQNTLANTYSSLSIWGEARRLREKVRDYYVTTFGPEHPDTLTAMFNLANTRQNENLPLMEEVFALRRKVLGPEQPDTLHTMSVLAQIYYFIGPRDKGLKLAEQALALHRKVLGPEHPNTLNAMYALALCCSNAGRLDESIKLLEEVLTHRRKTLGPKHPSTILTMWNLGATVIQSAGRQAEGLEMMDASLKIRREVEGDEHGDARWAMEKLAAIYENVGQQDKALKLREEVSATKPDETMLAMRLAASQVWFGQDTDYAATVRRMLDWAKDATKPDDLERVSKLACLRPIADAPTREAVLALARKAVDLGKENQGGMPWYQMTLGMAEYRSGHDAKAVEALTLAEAAAPSLAEERYRALIIGTAGFYRAMSLSRQGKPAEARTLLTATQAAMKPLPADDQNPTADGANHDDLILWLACKEAKTLLAEAGTPEK